MAIHLVTLVGDYGWRTLLPMLDHYRNLGVDAFHVTLHLKSERDPVRERVLDITTRFGCGLYDTVTGTFNDVQQEAYVKPRRDYPRDWFVLAGWNWLAMILLGIVLVAIRLRQEESQREIDSLRRMAHAM